MLSPTRQSDSFNPLPDVYIASLMLIWCLLAILYLLFIFSFFQAFPTNLAVKLFSTEFMEFSWIGLVSCDNLKLHWSACWVAIGYPFKALNCKFFLASARWFVLDSSQLWKTSVKTAPWQYCFSSSCDYFK